MGVYSRPDSPWWHLWIENAPPGRKREKTQIRIGTTKATRTDSRMQAEQLYAKRVLEHGAPVHRLPTERPVIRFAEFATWYDAHVLERHKGKEREREILRRLVRAFGDRLLHTIDKPAVIEWRTRRLQSSTVIPAFGSRKRVPMWLRIHRYLREHGPTPLRAIAAAFGLTTRNVCRTYLTPATERYFTRVRRGVWAAVGEPQVADRVLPPPSPRTVNREVDLLQQLLAAAVPKYVDASPIAGLPDLPVTEPVRRTMSHAEEALVLEQLAPVDRAIVLVGLDGLVRLSDILDLKRSDDQGTTLAIRDPKNRQPHHVPVSSRLRAALDAVPVDPRQPEWYFPTRRRASTESGRRSIVARALKRACQRAGVPYGRAAEGLTFHWSTRRTGATRMIRAGGDKVIAVTQRIGNWKHPHVLINIYQETVTEEMQAAVESVSGPAAARGDRPARRAQK